MPFSFRGASSDKWYVEYGSCEERPLDFREECIRTAQKISQSTSKEIWILSSGGVDSEVVLRSFHDAKIDVKVAILRFKNDLNLHDISYATAVCNELNIDCRIFNLDIETFLDSRDALIYGLKSQSFSPQLIAPMWLMDQIQGYCVLGSGDCYIVNRKQTHQVGNFGRYFFSNEPEFDPSSISGWDLWEKERVASWYRYLISTCQEGCPGFFQYSPEIMASYLMDPIVQSFLKSQNVFGVSTTDCKLAFYQKHFSILSRPKFTGYEKCPMVGQQLRSHLEIVNRGSNSVFRTPIEHLSEKLFRNFSTLDPYAPRNKTGSLAANEPKVPIELIHEP